MNKEGLFWKVDIFGVLVIQCFVAYIENYPHFKQQGRTPSRMLFW